MTSQPPQDEVEEVARALCDLEYLQPMWNRLPETESEAIRQYRAGDNPSIGFREQFREGARVAIATLDRLRSAAPAAEWSFDMDAAPKDKWLWVWCPVVEGLAPLLSLCLWHPDAGFCVDEIRTPVCWTRVQQPGHPLPSLPKDETHG